MTGTTPDLPTVIGDLDMQLRGLLGGHVAILTTRDLDVLAQLRTTLGRVLAEAGRHDLLAADLLAAFRQAIDEASDPDGSTHAAFYTLGVAVAELLDVSFDSYVSTTDHTGEDNDDA